MRISRAPARRRVAATAAIRRSGDRAAAGGAAAGWTTMVRAAVVREVPGDRERWKVPGGWEVLGGREVLGGWEVPGRWEVPVTEAWARMVQEVPGWAVTGRRPVTAIRAEVPDGRVPVQVSVRTWQLKPGAAPVT